MVSDTLTCFACEQEPTRQCPRCGRPYCEEHGDELCAICLQPASGVPSFSLYRGSLLALLIGAALAVWLLVQPTSSEGDSVPRPTVLTPTSAAAVAPTQGASGTQPAGNTTPGAATTGTPAASTPRAAGTGTPTTPAAGAGQYTVQAGDSLSAICASQRPALNQVTCVEQLRSRNGLTGDDLSVGQRLTLP
jgi:LysM repeat protein